MDARQREELERDIRRRCEEGDAQGAATAAIRGYGPELFEFLAASHRNDEDAADVFSLVTEGLWRDLPGFAWQCSFRTWAYAVARNASSRYRRGERRRAARIVPLPEGSFLSEVEAHVRSETVSYLRTRRRSKFAKLRDALPEEDRTLLVLRVDRELSWNDLARVMHDEDAGPLTDEHLKRESARLRKRFQLVKERLYEMGRREGLIGAGEDER